MNTLTDLLDYGQSYWLDNLTRKKITNGELRRRVTEEGLRGITSNPSIFNKAISDSADYDEQIKNLVSNGKSALQIYNALTIKDVQDACDILGPIYNESYFTDGFVSLEVSPKLARDTTGSIREARELYAAVGRPNCLIKIPGTKEGLSAIEQMLYEGININITLIFSVERYIEVARAYIRAIERRIAEDKPVSYIISVASIFISRIDTLIDQLLEDRILANNGNGQFPLPALLLGKAGNASAQLAYQSFKEIFNCDAWKRLQAYGAHMQRPLWASTSNKDPLHDDLRYVIPLIGRNTITTLTEETIQALANPGIIKRDSIEEGIEQARQLFTTLKKLEINMDSVTQQLENDGIQKFNDSYGKLLSNLASKRLKLLENNTSLQQINSGKLTSKVKALEKTIDERQVSRLIFQKDVYLWAKDSTTASEINKSLGWLTTPEHFIEKTGSITAFAASVKHSNYKYVVLLGMGGSSLCSQVTKETFERTKGYPQLLVLDNTSPEAILELEKKLDIEKTLFIVASKSGNTEETLCFFRYFYDQLEKKGVKEPGGNFIAITDEATPLTELAQQYNFRQVFINSPDLGGRYSVLSYFGLIPMALMGIDIESILQSALQIKNSSEEVPVAVNPAISLGILLGVCQKYGRDKVTFVFSPSITSLGLWIEQLIAESTGKKSHGLIPVNGEPLGEPTVYNNDRVFVYTYLVNEDNEATSSKIKNLEEAGHPVVRIRLLENTALGGEFYRWELAIAVAGLIMGINPFDQPNVEESKANTRKFLDAWTESGNFKKEVPVIKTEEVSVFGGIKTKILAAGHHESVGDFVRNFSLHTCSNDYIAFLPYFLLTPSRTKILQKWRQKLRDELKVATTLLEGPRYLHSTGQLHKGGPNTGLYIILVAEEGTHLPIPGKLFDFATMHTAQALGDFRSLDNNGRRVIRINLGKDVDAGLDKLYRVVKDISKQAI